MENVISTTLLELSSSLVLDGASCPVSVTSPAIICLYSSLPLLFSGLDHSSFRFQSIELDILLSTNNLRTIIL